MTANNCQQCQTPLPSDAPSGICPQCLLGLGMLGGGSNSSTAAMPGSSADSAPSVEQLLNRFPDLEILHLIGQGGMGAVYQARQKNLDRLVALKILSPRLGSDPTFAERFTREARTLAKLSHPNIVTVFNFGEVEGMYYLVMEYIEGVNLRDAIEAKTLDPEKALAVVPQICDALQYAHDKGVVHRDIKPENILVSIDGGVKIADFGLAKLLEPTAEDFTLTNTRQVMGTFKYMAPEQIEKPEDVDHRADLYSLGVVFYELLTGELPIGRFSLPSEKAAINGQLDDVVMKTLEKEPDRRYQQASQIKSAVADASHVRPVVVGLAPVAPAPPVKGLFFDKASLRRARLIGGILFFASIATMLLINLMGSGRAPVPPATSIVVTETPAEPRAVAPSVASETEQVDSPLRQVPRVNDQPIPPVNEQAIVDLRNAVASGAKSSTSTIAFRLDVFAIGLAALIGFMLVVVLVLWLLFRKSGSSTQALK